MNRSIRPLRLAIPLVLVCALPTAPAAAQDAAIADQLRALNETLREQNESLRHRLDALSRQVDDLRFEQQLGELAVVEKVRLCGPPLRYEPNPTAQGAGNPFVFWAYTFVPRQLDRTKPQPLIVLPHGGVHSNFATSYCNVLRELLEQGYSVVAPEYRGSTGYGRDTYEAIDYGGLEIEDTFAARNWMLERYPFLDPKRVGIIGWSHGGLHALMNVFAHGDAYAVAYAGVPVSDLIMRMGYKSQSYRDLYSADYHLGKSAEDDIEEYRRRSPSWNADRYDGTPLLIHTATNDEDVNVLEVERLAQALRASGKTGWTYRVYEAPPGGHVFNRIDTALARDSRREIWRFLAGYLAPERPAD
ncbi:MAG: S9 family peptidase [Planctomycetes bacterium]|nr:S9 family peptidase [Planctomycetota bacterium]